MHSSEIEWKFRFVFLYAKKCKCKKYTFRIFYNFNFSCKIDKNSKYAFKLNWRESTFDLLRSPVICRPSVRQSVRLSVCLFVWKLFIFPLLKSHLAKFNKTWHEASLSEGHSSLFNYKTRFFSRGDKKKK